MRQIEIAPDPSRRRWIILFIVFLSALSFGVTQQNVPPVLSLIVDELRLSHTEAGLLMSLFSLPGIFLSIPASMLADRYGQKRIFVASFVLMIVGSAVFATSNSLAGLLLGRMIAGVGTMTVVVLSPHLLSQWFAGREIGLAMGTNSSAFPLGVILSLNLLSFIGENFGWRVSIWVATAVPAVTLVLFLGFFVPAPGKKEASKLPGKSIFQSIKLAGTSIWLIGIAWALFNAALISFFTFTPDLLKSAGYSVATAGSITSATMWPAIPLNPILGYIIDKKNGKPYFIIAGGVMLAISLSLVPGTTSWALGLMLVIGVLQSLIPAPVYSLLPEFVSPAKLGLAFGINATCSNIGVLLGPASVGFLRDSTGSYAASYMLIAGFSALISIFITILILQRPELGRLKKVADRV